MHFTKGTIRFRHREIRVKPWDHRQEQVPLHETIHRLFSTNDFKDQVMERRSDNELMYSRKAGRAIMIYKLAGVESEVNFLESLCKAAIAAEDAKRRPSFDKLLNLKALFLYTSGWDDPYVIPLDPEEAKAIDPQKIVYAMALCPDSRWDFAACLQRTTEELMFEYNSRFCRFTSFLQKRAPKEMTL